MGRRTFLPIFTVKSRPPKSRLVVSLAAGARFRFNFAAFRRREFMSAVLPQYKWSGQRANGQNTSELSACKIKKGRERGYEPVKHLRLEHCLARQA